MKQNYIHFPFEQSILWSCASKLLLGIWYRKQSRKEHSSLMLSAYGIWQHYHHFKHTAPISGLCTNRPELHTAISECTVCSCTQGVFTGLYQLQWQWMLCASQRGKNLQKQYFKTESVLKEAELQSFPTEGTQMMNLGTILQHTCFKGWCSKLRSSEIYFSFKIKHEAKKETHYLFRNTQIFPNI